MFCRTNADMAVVVLRRQGEEVKVQRSGVEPVRMQIHRKDVKPRAAETWFQISSVSFQEPFGRRAGVGTWGTRRPTLVDSQANSS